MDFPAFPYRGGGGAALSKPSRCGGVGWGGGWLCTLLLCKVRQYTCPYARLCLATWGLVLLRTRPPAPEWRPGGPAICSCTGPRRELPHMRAVPRAASPVVNQRSTMPGSEESAQKANVSCLHENAYVATGNLPLLWQP